MNNVQPVVNKSKQGCLSAFCDATLRTNKVWSTDHLFDLLKSWVLKENREITIEDLVNPVFINYCNDYLHQRLAQREANPVSLLIQDVRTFQGKTQVADIRYGWDISKGTGRRIKAAKLPPLRSAFTVAHANEYIPHASAYQSLEELLRAVSTSHLEKKFYTEWLHRYHKDEAPALIPEVHRFSLAGDACGQRTFWYEDFNKIGHRGRIDFFVYNAAAGRALFIELDGHNYHKTKEQRQIDAIKRNVCAEAQIPLKVYTTADIEDNLPEVFNKLDSVLGPSI